jgi:hypothetical protein
VSTALAAHGLHYVLLAAGLVLVVVLLRSGRRRRSGGTGDDHERRVAELRKAARSGGLGAVAQNEHRERPPSS